MGKVLGLDIGTNSIGWALVDKENKKIVGMGSRIVPIGAEIKEFEKGNAQTKNAERRIARGIRKGNKRYKARRNKLIYVLQALNMLPKQIRLSEEFSDPKKIQKINVLPINDKTKQLTAKQNIDLRIKALKGKIDLEDFGKILYQYNQLRGYAGGGQEEDAVEVEEKDNDTENEDDFKKSEKIIDIIKIIALPENYNKKDERINNKKSKIKYTVTIELQNETIEDENSFDCDTYIDNLEKGKEIEVEISITRGTGKKNKGEIISKYFSLPKKTNWRKEMEDLENILDESSKREGREYFISEYFRDLLNQNKWEKIRNKVVLRKRYIAEFNAIWTEQAKYYGFLNNTNSDVLNKITNFIFPGTNPENDSNKKQKEFREKAILKGLKYIIQEQIIYYQRDLKDQSTLVGKCRFEKDEYVIAVSNPLFQEYKIWQQINNLSINTRIETGKKKDGTPKYDYSNSYIEIIDKESLYDLLQIKKEYSAKQFYKKLKEDGKIIEKQDFLEGIHIEAKLKGNDTKKFFEIKLKNDFQNLNLSNENTLTKLWEILFDIYGSGKGNEYDLESPRCKNIKNFILENYPNCPNVDDLTKKIAKLSFARKYGSLSKKAIENIIPLMRAGKYFNSELPQNIHDAVSSILYEVQDDSLKLKLQEELEKHQDLFFNEGGLKASYATMLAYNDHRGEQYKGDTINNWWQIKGLDTEKDKLRNPIAEQMINETLQIVKSIWKHYGEKPSEIKIELARELKNSAKERKEIYSAQRKAEERNGKIKTRLIEYANDLKKGNLSKYDEWGDASKCKTVPFNGEPTKYEIEKVKLWEQQKMISPYTGKIISFCDLFDKSKYDIDHIIPKTRYYDDSLSNKVICETSVNRGKSNRLPLEYLQSNSSTIAGLLEEEKFINEVNRNFFGRKRKNLLATKIPTDPVARQIKDTQYITVKVREKLSEIVGTTNVKTTTGGVTDYLRAKWGLREEFMEITQDRFKRMEIITGEEGQWVYTKRDENKNKNVFEIKNWSKRYDHRHHAIDALIVACTDEKTVKRLNDLNKVYKEWLKENQNKIFKDNDVADNMDLMLEKFNEMPNDERNKWLQGKGKGFRVIESPWDGFKKQAGCEIEKIIVSHKPKEKLIIQKIQKGNDANKKDMLRIRGQLHRPMPWGKNNEGYETQRVRLEKLAGNNSKSAVEKLLNKVISKSIRADLLNHLKNYKDKHKEAFSTDGLRIFNENRQHPVYSVKVSNTDLSKPPKEGLTAIIKKNQTIYVETNDNYCYAIVEKEGKRVFDKEKNIITFKYATDELNRKFNAGYKNIAQIFENYFSEIFPNSRLLFTLKQGDLVFVPIQNEIIPQKGSEEFSKFWKDKERLKRIYKVVQISEPYCKFVPHTLANVISYKKLEIISNELNEDEEVDNSEQEKDKNSYGEYLTYRDCSPFVMDDSWYKNALGKSDRKSFIKNSEKEIDEIIGLIQNENLMNEIPIETENKLLELCASDTKLKNYLKEKDVKLFEEVKTNISTKEKELKKNTGKKDKNEGITIQKVCFKLELDRLGNVISVKG